MVAANKNPKQSNGDKTSPETVKVLVRAATPNAITAASEASKYNVTLILTPVSDPVRDIVVVVTIQGMDCGTVKIRAEKSITFNQLTLDNTQDVNVVVANAENPELAGKATIPAKHFPASTPTKKIELLAISVENLAPNLFNPITIRAQNADGSGRKSKIRIIIGQCAETHDGKRDANGVFEFETDPSGLMVTLIRLHECDTTATIIDDRNIARQTSLLKEP